MVGLNGKIGANVIMNVPLRMVTGKDPELTEIPEKLRGKKKFAIMISNVSFLKRIVHFQNDKKVRFGQNNKF